MIQRDGANHDIKCDLALGLLNLSSLLFFFFFNDTATTEIYTLSLHDALPIWGEPVELHLQHRDNVLSVRVRAVRAVRRMCAPDLCGIVIDFCRDSRRPSMPRWIWGPLALLMVTLGTAPLPAQPAEPLKIGVFDPETIWKITEVGKKYNQDLNEARDRLQGDIDKKQAEIDALRDKLRQQQASLSEDKAAQMQKNIQNKTIELNRRQDDATR